MKMSRLQSLVILLFVITSCAKERPQEEQLTPFAANKVQIKQDQQKTLISTDELSLQAIVSNACVRELSTEEKKDFLGNDLYIDLSEMIDIPVQSYPLILKGQLTQEQIAEYANLEECVVGITNDEDLGLEAKDLEFTQANDITESGLSNYIHPDYMKVSTAKRLHFSSVLNRGKPVVIAIVDSGVTTGHEDLRNVHYENARYHTDFSEDGDAEDFSGHGSHVAGLAGSVLDFNPNAVQLMGVKVLNRRGRGKASSVFNGIIYAVHKGADVINMSLGSGSDKSYSMYAEAIGYAIRNNVLIVTAAGNDYRRVGNAYDSEADNPSRFEGPWPSAFSTVKGVLNVGSIDISTAGKSRFSNHGPNVDIWAAGCDSPQRRGMPSVSIRGGYSYRCGTSMASPVLAGVAALVIKHYKAQGKGVSVSVVEDILTSSATDASGDYRGQVNLVDIALKLRNNTVPQNPDFIIADAYDQYVSDLYSTFLVRPHLTEEVRLLSQVFKSEKKSFAWLLKKVLDEYPKKERSCNRVVKPLFYAATRQSVRRFSELDLICDAYEAGSIDNETLVSTIVASKSFLNYIESIGLHNHPASVLEEGRLVTNQEFNGRKQLDSYIRQSFSRPALGRDFAMVKGKFGALNIEELVENSDAKYVLELYKSILYRTQESLFFDDLEGWNYWTDMIASGRLTREQVKSYMESSKEKWVREVFEEFALAQLPKKEVDPFVIALIDGSKTEEQVREEIRNFTPTLTTRDPLTEEEVRDEVIRLYDDELDLMISYTEGSEIGADIFALGSYARQQVGLNNLREELRTSPRGQLLGLFYDVLRRAPSHDERIRFLTDLSDGASLDEVRQSLQELRFDETGIIINEENEVIEKAITELYQEILNRAPDAGGLGYWMSEFARGVTLEEIRKHFENSYEARMRALYLYHFQREPDFDGLQYWVGRLNDGMAFEGIRRNFRMAAECKVDCL